MRQGQQNRRGRGRSNNNGPSHQGRKGQHHHNPLMRTYQSNGPDQKIHGTPAQIAEKYMSLARDALSSGDPVLAENYLQHAEHYNRIILAYREQQMQQQGSDAAQGGLPRPRQFSGQPGEPFDPNGDGSEGEGEELGQDGSPTGAVGGSMGGAAGQFRGNEQQPRMHDHQHGGNDERPRQQGGEFRNRDRDRDYGHGQGQHSNQNQHRDRDGNRHFRQRYGQDRGDHRGPDRNQDRSQDRNQDRGEHRNDRGDRGPDMRGERFDRPDQRSDQRHDRSSRQDGGGERFERNERHERPERHDRGDRNDRSDRGDRSERQERMPRPAAIERVERVEPADRQPVIAERPYEPVVIAPIVDAAPVVVAETAAPAPASRRRERFTEAQHEQPEFLRRPVRRPRREAAGSDAVEGKAAPRPVDGDVPGKD